MTLLSEEALDQLVIISSENESSICEFPHTDGRNDLVGRLLNGKIINQSEADVILQSDKSAPFLGLEEKDFTDNVLPHIWTIIDDGGETDNLYASAGFHSVNSLGMLVTEKPWPTITTEAYYYKCDEEEMDINGDTPDEQVGNGQTPSNSG